MAYAPKILSGVDVIDEAWGGLYRGGSYLVYGRAATGRGLLTLMFAQTGAMLEERCLFISPDRPKDLMIQAASMGFNLREAHETGLVKMMRIPPMLNLQEIGDDGIAKALNDLVSIVRQNRPDRLVINDFMPFVQFRSFDRFRGAFVQMLEQIDSLDTTVELVLAEPANEQSRKVVEFMRSQMTGAVHIELVGEDAQSTKRRLTLIPNIGHIRRHVVEFWDLQKVVEEFDENVSSSLRMLPVTRGEQFQTAARAGQPQTGARTERSQGEAPESAGRRRYRFGDSTAAPSAETGSEQASAAFATSPPSYKTGADYQPKVHPRRLGGTRSLPHDSAAGSYAPSHAAHERTAAVWPIPLGRHAAPPSEPVSRFQEPPHDFETARSSSRHSAMAAPESRSHRTERSFADQPTVARPEHGYRRAPVYHDERMLRQKEDQESAFGYADEPMQREETEHRAEPTFRSQQPAYRPDEPRSRRDEPAFPREEPAPDNKEPAFRPNEPVHRGEERAFRPEEPAQRRKEPAFRQDEPVNRREEPEYQQDDSADRAPAGYRVDPVYQDEPYTTATARQRGEPIAGSDSGSRERTASRDEPAPHPETGYSQEPTTEDEPAARSSTWAARPPQFRMPDQPAEPRFGEHPTHRTTSPDRAPTSPSGEAPTGAAPAQAPSTATAAPRGRASHTDRDAFRTRLQQHFLRRDVNETPFLLVAMRMDRTEERAARPFDFDFILDLVSELLREQDDMLVELDRERLIVLLANSRPEEAQQFFARLKNRLRDEAPQQADHLLHSVSAIVVPDGRPFQNAEEFLTYALDEG